MAWDEREPLKRYIRNQRVVDAALRKALLAAANDAKRLLARTEPGSMRAAQLELQQQQLRLWAKIGTVIDDGVMLNANMVAQANIIFTDEMLKRMGVKSSAEFRRQMVAQAQNTIRNYLAREQLGMSLSDRVYRNGVVSSGRIDRVINNALLRGASAREIARDVAGLINPNTPGGVSYAAMRLGRTELNNSFHQAAMDSYSSNPFINKVRWSLSGSHPKTDHCDDLVGVYDADNVPDKPHPQCFCYITPEAMSLNELARRFKRGEFDEWADAQGA